MIGDGFRSFLVAEVARHGLVDLAASSCTTTEDAERCWYSGEHCECWWEGGVCCWCEDPAMGARRLVGVDHGHEVTPAPAHAAAQTLALLDRAVEAGVVPSYRREELRASIEAGDGTAVVALLDRINGELGVPPQLRGIIVRDGAGYRATAAGLVWLREFRVTVRRALDARHKPFRGIEHISRIADLEEMLPELVGAHPQLFHLPVETVAMLIYVAGASKPERALALAAEGEAGRPKTRAERRRRRR